MNSTLAFGKALVALAAVSILSSGCAGANAVSTPTPTPSDLIGGGLNGGQVSDSEWKSTVAQVLPGIVKIVVSGCDFEGSGTGFSVGKWVVTNRHVVENAKTLGFRDAKGKLHEASSWRYAKSDDLALISVEPPSENSLELAESDGISGDLVATGGYPLGGPQVSNRGRLIEKSSDFRKRKSSATYVWKTNAEILPGDSGGPLINTQGKVVGVMFALDLMDGTKLAIPVSRLKYFLENPEKMTLGRACGR